MKGKGNSFLNKHIYSQFKASWSQKAIIYLTGQSDPQIKSWTYQELFHAVQNLKNHILSKIGSIDGEIKGSVIAVAVNDYPDYIIALLAIWELNCVYMPLDPNPKCKNPKEWIATRLQLAGARVFITNREKFDQSFFSEIKDITHLEWEKIPSQENLADILLQTSLEECEYKENSNLDTAYIYSSSGTSGTPKMIENTFEGLWGRVYGTADLLGIQTGSGILGYCAPDFDASLLDILMALSKGACLYPVHEAARTQLGLIKYIFEIANKEKIPITSAVLTPVVLRELKTIEPFHSLNTMITMGEECGIECLKYWFEVKGLRIFNGYGPTETTIAATVTKLDRDAFNNPTDEESKEKNQNLLPMHHTLPGVELYFLEEKDNTSRVLNKSEIKELEESGKDVQIIIGGLGVGRYRKPASSNGNTEAEQLITQLNDEHFICQNEKEKWIYKQHGSDKDSKTIEIAGNNLPFEKGCRYYLTGDKVHITPSQTPIGYDLRFIARIDNAGKRNGIWTSFEQVEELIKRNCEDTVKQVKVVPIKKSFAAFITPPKQLLAEEEEEFEEKFFKNLYRNKEEESRLLPSFYFLINPVAGSINNIKSAQTFKALLGEAKRLMIPRSKTKADTQSFNEIEQKIIKIWQSILFGDMSEISDFKKLYDQEAIKSLFTRESHFQYLGGDSLSMQNMIYRVWHKWQNSDPPLGFINAVLADPRLNKIVYLIHLYTTIEVILHGTSKEYPWICVHENKGTLNIKKTLFKKSLCEVVIKKNEPVRLSDAEITQAIEEKIRSVYPAGPYRLALINKQNKKIIKQLSINFRKSDFTRVINLKFSKKNNIRRKIKNITIKLIEQSCIHKIKKWNKDDLKQFHLVYRGEFPQIPKEDTWYQSAAYSGKTEFLKSWRRELWKNTKVWPIYLDVDGYDEKNSVEILFNKIGFCDKEIKYLKNKKILLMIDHYDRMLRNDILDFRSNGDFKNWKNLTIWVVSRYLQIEKLIHDKDILMPNFNIITESKSNYLLAEVLKENKLKIFFDQYVKEEQTRHKQLKQVKIDPNELIHFLQISNLDEVCIEKSPWELPDTENNLVQFSRDHPYFMILRGLLSRTDNEKYYFPPELKQLLDPSQDLSFTPLHSEEDKTFSKSAHLYESKPLTIETFLSENRKSICRLSLQDQRIPIIAFYPLTGEVPNHYLKLFDMIGSFQPWLAFAMNIDRFAKIEEKTDIMNHMAEYYADILTRLSAYFQSYILLGWSFGALLAFSVAEKLVKSKIQVDLVINIDCPPPSYLSQLLQLERAKYLVFVLAKQEGYNLDSATITEIQKVIESSETATPKEFFGQIRNSLTNNPKHYSSFTDMLKRAEINLQAYYDFKAEKITSPLIVAVANERTTGLNDQANYEEWRKFTSDLNVQCFPYNHFNIFSPELATWIRKKIQEKQGPISPLLFPERLKKYYASVIKDPPLFIDLEGAENETSQQRTSLLELCQDFLNGKNQYSLLVYGPPGSGKSTLLMKLATHIIEEKTTHGCNPTRVIYIKMESHSGCIKEELLRSGFTLAEYEEWKKIPSVIIMDGLEKLGEKVNLWEKNNLDTWFHVKLIVSYRHEALVHGSNEYRRYLANPKVGYRKIYCLPLSKRQINEYLTQCSSSVDLTERFQKLRIHGFFTSILSNPLIFSMLAKLLENHHITTLHENSRYDFYKYFFKQQIELAKYQLSLQNGIFIGTDLTKASWHYVLKLANDIFNGCQNPEFILPEKSSTQQARTASAFLLTFKNGKIQFIHDTYLEFFYATTLWRWLNDENLLTQQHNPWRYLPLYKNFSLLNFIVDQFNKLKPELREEKGNYLVKCLQEKQEKNDESYFSSNLISFLILAKQAFNHLKFSDLSFKEAHLTNAIFNDCIFDKIDLSQGIIHNSLFNKCQFGQLESVDFNKIRLSSDFRIPIIDCISICNSPVNPNWIGYLGKQYYRGSIEPALGIYDLKKRKCITVHIEKNKIFNSIDFDVKGNLVGYYQLSILDDTRFSISNFITFFNDRYDKIKAFILYLGYLKSQKCEDRPEILKLFDLCIEIINICEFKANNKNMFSLDDPFSKALIKIKNILCNFSEFSNLYNYFLNLLKKSELFEKHKEMINQLTTLLLYFRTYLSSICISKASINLPKIKTKYVGELTLFGFRPLPGTKGQYAYDLLGGDIKCIQFNENIQDYERIDIPKRTDFHIKYDPFYYVNKNENGILIDIKEYDSKDSFDSRISSPNPNKAISVAVNNNNELLAIVWANNTSSVVIYQPKKMTQITPKSFYGNNNGNAIIGLAFNPETSLLATADKNNVITIFNLQNQKIIALINSPNQFHEVKSLSCRMICFSDNQTLLTLSNQGISVWDLEGYLDNHLFDFSIPRFFSTLTFDTSEQKNNLPCLYAGDMWGNVSELDIHRGSILKTICRFEGEIIEKMITYGTKTYFVIVTYIPDMGCNKLYILMNQYTQIGFEGVLALLPNSIYFSSENHLILSVNFGDFDYEISSNSSSQLMLKLVNTELRNPPEKPLPNIYIPEILKILIKITDWEYSNPYLILMGINFTILCCKLEKDKIDFLWATGPIGNNFQYSTLNKTKNLSKKNLNKLEAAGANLIGIASQRELSLTMTDHKRDTHASPSFQTIGFSNMQAMNKPANLFSWFFNYINSRKSFWDDIHNESKKKTQPKKLSNKELNRILIKSKSTLINEHSLYERKRLHKGYLNGGVCIMRDNSSVYHL